MLQIIQYQKDGAMFIEELPVPAVQRGKILVRNFYSCISAGTEKTSVTTAQASMLGKARNRPDLVRQVRDNFRREGLVATYQKIKTRLDTYKELGYSSAGVVVESGVDEFQPGDRVACGGLGYASHAEYVLVPRNLAVKVPPDVTLEDASYATVGAIAMQGVRQADVRLGESVAVIGLGLLGLLTAQMLRANGCRVVGLDISPANFELARKLGINDCVTSDDMSPREIEAFTGGLGTDAVIITAGTLSNKPIELALQYARKKSKIVVVGAVSMDIPRSPFYEKELDLRISCSYGPGRYDPEYEEKGRDYPAGYVRWTERRNMESVIELIRDRKLDVRSLTTHTIPIGDGLRAYDIITGKQAEPFLGILIHYPGEIDPAPVRKRERTPSGQPQATGEKPAIGFIGAGNFAQSYLIPPLQQLPVQLKGVSTARAVNAKSVADKFGFAYCATESADILNDAGIKAVMVATRHDSHASYVIESLRREKHVFVEKPLATTQEDLDAIRNLVEKGLKNPIPYLCVGFNRRFSAPMRDMQAFFADHREPLAMMYRVNAGFVPSTNWVQDPVQGGRIIGEACHFIDTMAFVSGARPTSVVAAAVRSPMSLSPSNDTMSIVMTFEDGSVGTLLYLANGDASVGKEYFEVFGGGRTGIMDNFRRVSLYHDGKVKKNSYNGSKGHKEEMAHFINVITGRESAAFSFDELFDVTRTTFLIGESLQKGSIVRLRQS